MVYVIRAPSYEFSDELDNANVMIAVLLPVGGNRTHVTVPKDLLPTIAEYHSAIEVLIEFDKYFHNRVVFSYRRKKVLWYRDVGSIPADW